MSQDANRVEPRNKEIIRGAQNQKQIPRGARVRCQDSGGVHRTPETGDDNRREAAEISIGCLSYFAFSELRSSASAPQ